MHGPPAVDTKQRLLPTAAAATVRGPAPTTSLYLKSAARGTPCGFHFAKQPPSHLSRAKPLRVIDATSYSHDRLCGSLTQGRVVHQLLLHVLRHGLVKPLCLFKRIIAILSGQLPPPTGFVQALIRLELAQAENLRTSSSTNTASAGLRTNGGASRTSGTCVSNRTRGLAQVLAQGRNKRLIVK